jgi:hypothetical protein
MFFMIFIMFVMCGSICVMLPLLMPGFFIEIVFIGLQVMGVMIIWVGALLYAARSVATGGYLLNEMAKPNEVLALHERRGGTARLRRGTLDILEHIRLKGMLLKDTGGGIRIAGHRIVSTKETVNHTIPEWAAQYIHMIHDKYMVDSPDKLKALYIALKGLHKEIPGLDTSTIKHQLEQIPELEMVMRDEKKKQSLLDMELIELQNMAELLYDGQIIHMEDYEKFQEAASPYDLESYNKKHEIRAMMRWFHYKDVNTPDWMKYAIVIFIICLGAGMAFMMMKGG